jgi:hypothetical protein
MRNLIAGALIALASTAAAGPICTAEKGAAWLTEGEMRAKVVAAGTAIDVFKVTDGNCYEVYGRGRDGRRVEIYYDPVSGDVLKSSAR